MRGRVGARLRAAELFAAGVRQAEVARQLGVSAQAVSVWHGRWKQGGADALWLLGLAIGTLLGLYFYVRRDRYSEPGPDADETRFPR